MAFKTIYTCDKCGNEQEKPNQFWTVGVSATHSAYPPNNEFVQGKHMHVCRPCLESFGIHVQKRPEHAQNPPQIPSVEDLIRELVQRCS